MKITLRHWDTIIIGAGIGGLTAAAKLVDAGLRVLVLEKNPHPGGTAYVYQRKGFSFPMGPLGFSNLQVVKDILKECGSKEKLSFDRIHFRLRAFDLDLPLSLPFSEMVDVLKKRFPADEEPLKRFFGEVRQIGAIHPSLAPNDFSEEQQVPKTVAAADYLDRSIRDRRLRCILGSLGTREPYSSFALQAAMWKLMCEEGIWYPKEGMKSFCELLVRRVGGADRHKGDRKFEDKPAGVVRLSTEVSKIRVINGHARGVVLKDGMEIESDCVISNADFKTTFLKLMSQDNLPRNWYHAVSEARQTNSVLQVCLGVWEKKVDLAAFVRATRLIYRRAHETEWRDQEIDWSVDKIDPEALAAQELEIALWSQDDRRLAPPGGAVIIIRAEAPYAHFAKYRSGFRKRTLEYMNYKKRLGKALVREVAQVLPGLCEAIVTMDVATPLTFEDQGGRSEGAVAGWSWDYSDFKDPQPRELIRTPIHGLYMAGYQAFSGLFMGGVPTAMLSGLRAAQAVLDGTAPAEELLILSRVQD